MTLFFEPLRHKSGAKVHFFCLSAKFFGKKMCLFDTLFHVAFQQLGVFVGQDGYFLDGSRYDE